jgi:hypothetical protein
MSREALTERTTATAHNLSLDNERRALKNRFSEYRFVFVHVFSVELRNNANHETCQHP